MLHIVVLSQFAPRYRELIDRRGIAGAELHYATTLAEAMPHTGAAEILFGAPDLLAEALPHCPKLQWVQSSWAGVTPLLATRRRDYCLTGVKEIFGTAMTEFVLGWLLALERNIPARYRARVWDDRRDGQIAGKAIGIMGTGSIGAAVARGCKYMGLTTRGLNSDGRDVQGFDDCWATPARLEFADGLDYLVALLPDTPGTDGLVDKPLLARLRGDAIFINCGRGNAVTVEDLQAALASGRLRHAVLDVLPQEPLPEHHPLWQTPGISITSHTAAPTPGDAIVDVFLDNFRRFAAGEPLRHVVDFEKGY
jgi:phosphoglycerate dehydrogenase-like enzyme